MLPEKSALGFQKKNAVSKTLFIIDIWNHLVTSQQKEIEKAIYGESRQFRLSKDAEYLRLSIEDWYNFTDEQKRLYVSAFNSTSKAGIEKMKTIVVPGRTHSVKTLSLHKTALSSSLPNLLPFLLHAELIERKAIGILNAYNGIVSAPTMEHEDKVKKFLVAGGGTYCVKIETKGISCTCKGFKFAKICSHTTAVAETENLLIDLISKVKLYARSSITYPANPGAGRKGGQRRRQRVYQSESNEYRKEIGLFTKNWHNNEPFVICWIDDIPATKNLCFSCKREFLRCVLSIIPFEIALKHQERWQYRNKERGHDQPQFLPSKKMTDRYYCIKEECVITRFPDFRAELLVLLHKTVPAVIPSV